MSKLLRRKEKNLIPPVEDSPDPSFTPPNRPTYPQSSPSRYTRNNDRSDVYARGERDLNVDRNQLFAGYNPENRAGSNRFRDGPSSKSFDQVPDGENEEEDVEAIKTQSRFTKQESVNSTRNALRIAREAEETGRNTLLRLGDQSEKMANTERHLDISKGHSNKAEDKTDELKQLNRSIFRPVITFNKDAKRLAQQSKLQARWDEEKEERERTMADLRGTQQRIGGVGMYASNEQDDDGILQSENSQRRGRFRTEDQLRDRKEQRKKYQFEATASDDEIEDELDDNLDEIGDAARRLKELGLAVGQELDSQNKIIERIEGKVGRLDNKLYMNTERLKNIR